ncbi:MAG: penicillin-binding transpeptidase domain-containing protein, partial [Patescibacteria group bacterium]
MFKKRKTDPKIYPEEIFMDSENISEFDVHQFEGRLEKAINKKTFLYLSVALGMIAAFFLAKLFHLQILKGEQFAQRSERNSLKKEILIPLRGVIYDKNKLKLAWNGENGRVYVQLPGLSHVSGYTGLPSKEDFQENEDIFTEAIIGKSGIEKTYENFLKGEAGIKLIEISSQNNIVSESVQKPPQNGKNLDLTIDSRVQSQFFRLMESVARERGFEGGAGIILDAKDGSVLSMISWPEYDSQILSEGGPNEKIDSFIKNENKPFVNRAIAGLYAPGSIIKPLIALAALSEGTISPQKEIFSAGSISIPNPFFEDKKSVFRDWKAHGWVDMRRALAVSSDVYFYEVGGGFEDIKGLGINKIKEYAEMFGLNKETGIDINGELHAVIPSPELKSKNDPDDPIWRIGDTYNTSIGQGYFLVTPIQVAAYAATIANSGQIIKPHVVNSPIQEIGSEQDIQN